MDVIWIGEPYFASHLRESGFGRSFIHKPAAYKPYNCHELVELAGFVPDILVVSDFSSPPLVAGIEDAPFFTVFYSVDSHIHSWHHLYAQAFDACLFSLKDNGSKFKRGILPENRIWWSPPFAHDSDAPEPDTPKIWDSVFVGTNNPDLNPGRYKFLSELSAKVKNLHISSGPYKHLYAQGKTVINQAANNDLNFRVFEALGCGGCLVTPEIGNGLLDLFTDGEHLITYEPGDADDAASKITRLLRNDTERLSVAEQGLAQINRAHRPIHRASAFYKRLLAISQTGFSDIIKTRKAGASDLRANLLSMFYLSFASELDDPAQRYAFLQAAKGNLY